MAWEERCATHAFFKRLRFLPLYTAYGLLARVCHRTPTTRTPPCAPILTRPHTHTTQPPPPHTNPPEYILVFPCNQFLCEFLNVVDFFLVVFDQEFIYPLTGLQCCLHLYITLYECCCFLFYHCWLPVCVWEGVCDIGCVLGLLGSQTHGALSAHQGYDTWRASYTVQVFLGLVYVVV